MSTDSRFDATIERFTGFGAHYDQVRPEPPRRLAELLGGIARCPRPALVVDLGSGTGLASRYWARHAEKVIGIEPTASMREQAQADGGANIEYREGYSHATGLPDGCADLVVCSQALHWMDPQATFAEARRILREGGVFAACDYDWPPATLYWEADAAYVGCQQRAERLERERGIAARLHRWDKAGHLGRMRESNCFRHVRECLLHHRDTGTADRVAGLLMSQGSVQTLLKEGVTEDELGIGELRATVRRAFDGEAVPWFWSARVRLGVK
ncbi:MAG: class I SAM-dependent methyltransferase [Verrucomicrobiota bacterium JB024]|nr:class I SAM-dependent methyltransferase [Verrucomicrobiota bacterium JB024]